MDFLNDIIKERGGDLVAALTSKAGFSADQATRFVPAAGSSVMDALTARASDLDLGNLTSASAIGTITQQLDVGALSQKAGVTADQGAKGLSAILPMLMGLIGEHAKGAGGLLSMLTASGGAEGGLGAVRGLAGKFMGGR